MEVKLHDLKEMVNLTIITSESVNQVDDKHN